MYALMSRMMSYLYNVKPRSAELIVDEMLLIKYQPQFDNTGRCIGTESLLRWEHVRYKESILPVVDLSPVDYLLKTIDKNSLWEKLKGF